MDKTLTAESKPDTSTPNLNGPLFNVPNGEVIIAKFSRRVAVLTVRTGTGTTTSKTVIMLVNKSISIFGTIVTPLGAAATNDATTEPPTKAWNKLSRTNGAVGSSPVAGVPPGIF